VPDERVPIADRDLARSGKIEMAQAPDLVGERGPSLFGVHAKAPTLERQI
jgi:hypothetical protein